MQGIIGDSRFRNNLLQTNYGILRWVTGRTPLCGQQLPPEFQNLVVPNFNLYHQTQDPSQTVGAYSGFDGASLIHPPRLANPVDRPGFTLLPKSPARDLGSYLAPSWVVGSEYFRPYTPPVELDHFGDPRLQPSPSSAVDLGADEYHCTTSLLTLWAGGSEIDRL